MRDASLMVLNLQPALACVAVRHNGREDHSHQPHSSRACACTSPQLACERAWHMTITTNNNITSTQPPQPGCLQVPEATEATCKAHGYHMTCPAAPHPAQAHSTMTHPSVLRSPPAGQHRPPGSLPLRLLPLRLGLRVLPVGGGGQVAHAQPTAAARSKLVTVCGMQARALPAAVQQRSGCRGQRRR
jgi:hypothetical protein